MNHLTFSHRSAAVGAIAWLALLALPLPTANMMGLVHRLLLVAPLMIVPLALTQLTPRDDAAAPLRHLHRAAVWLQPALAACAVASLYLPGTGVTQAAAALPWLLETGLLALLGLARLHDRWRRGGGSALERLGPVEELALDAGLLYVPVGGAWWVASRYGGPVMGFDPVIVLLTAAHFHYAGLAAPFITGLVGRAIPDGRPAARRLYAVAATAASAGPPLIALGITLSPLLEVVCAVILASGLLLLSGLMVFVVRPRMPSRLGAALCTIAAASLLLTMALACTYALAEFQHTVWVGIPDMAAVHGSANVFGFSLCGMLAMVLMGPPPR